ncbi:hypothetical protein ACOJCM_10150 [Billgrantia sp. LNSP4103-1]|uniref:hypothetical protein n=1 Tax=Billgrantia sp. LNSP4103-1 TaxID=3410266 RepID=UPI00403FA835
MANSREGRSQQDTIEAMVADGWKAGMVCGYDSRGKDVSELELPYYRLTKREEKRLRLEVAGEDCGLTSVSEVGSGKPHDPEKQRLAEIIDRLIDLYGVDVSDDDKLRLNSSGGFSNSRPSCFLTLPQLQGLYIER